MNAAQSTFLGTNMSGIADWSTQYPFLNYFKSSRDWITHTENTWSTEEQDKLQVDDDGWLKSLDGGQFTSVGTLLPNDDQGRRFVVLYDGQGTIQYREGAQKDNAASRPGRDVFYAKPGENLNLRITETDPSGNGNYLRNIRVVPEEYEAIADSQTFNPDFLESLKGFKTLRFMDWMDTNDSDQSRWENRPDATDSEYFGEGVPVEVMVELANETGIDPWFTLPHKATDEYVRNFAEYAKENLDSDRKVYVEFSNEVWNGQFEQAKYASEQGRRTVGGSDFENRQKWYGQRTGQITQIWDDVFGGDKDRVIGVLGAQAANLSTAETSLDALQATGKSYQELGIDAIAIAPYFGGYMGSPKYQSQVESWTRDPDGGLDKLFREINQGGVLNDGPEGGSLQRAKGWMNDYAQLANRTGLELMAYEGGQHLVGHGGIENNRAITNLFIQANRDPRMGQAYKDYLDIWQQVTDGGTFANFSDIYKAGKYGSWGLRDSLYQESTPKFNAIQDVLKATGAATAPPAPEPAPPIDDSSAPITDEEDGNGDETDADNGADDGAGDDIGSEIDGETGGDGADGADGADADNGVDDGAGDGADDGAGGDGTDGADIDDGMGETGSDGADGGTGGDVDAPIPDEMPSDGGSGGGAPTPDNGPTMPAPSEPIRIEAEDMTLEGYRLEGNDQVSGQQVISLVRGATDERGTASQTFDGPAGTYDVVVSYIDETDGVATLEARLNGEALDQWQLSQDLGSPAIGANNQVQRTVAEGVSLKSGDIMELVGQEQSFEHARVDYVEFVPVAGAAPATPPTTPEPPAPAPEPAPPAAEPPMGGSGTAVTLAESPISLSGNALKSVAVDYDITPDTMMQLEFRGSGSGAIQAIGFDKDVFWGEGDGPMFKLSGTEDWTVAEDLSDQVAGTGWQTLEVAVGQYTTDDYDHLTLLNVDGGQADVTGEFRNIRLFEAPMGAMTAEQGSGAFDDTPMDSPMGMPMAEEAIAA
ncbi:MAG: hypothetical protein AAF289_06060 [Cyanobacteria bacterium P01_A01_bin.135]